MLQTNSNTSNGTAIGSVANYKWHHLQPQGVLAPGKVISLVAHIAGAPVTEGASVTVAAQ